MISLRSYFESLEKTTLREVYAKTFAMKGLVNNILLLKELQSFYTNSERLASVYSLWTEQQKDVFLLIARSGKRGLRFRELRLAVPVGQVNALRTFLKYLCENFIVWKTAGETENTVYRSFAESYAFALSKKDFIEIPTKVQEFSHGSLCDVHICRVLSLLKLGKLRLNASKDLHRRSLQLCEETTSFSKKLSPKASNDEILLILQFLVSKSWLVVSTDSQLILASEALTFLNKNGFRLHQEFFRWWLETRFNGDKKYFSELMNLLQKPVSAQKAVEIFWPLDPVARLQSKKANISFEQMPRPLREMWIMGLVNFHVNRSFEIEAVSSNEISENSNQAIAKNLSVSTLPNFEVVIPSQISPRVLFYASCFAIAENDESILKYRLDKEVFAEALRSGFSEQEVKLFFSWLNLPENVSMALYEWSASFFGASIFTARILKIDDKSIFEDLSGFPQFMELVQASIPNYGFLIKPECEQDVRNLLIHYGLTPACDRDESSLQVINELAFSSNFTEPWPQENMPEMGKENPSVKESSVIETGKKNFGTDFQKLDVSTLVKALRYAKTSETLCVLRLANPERKTAKVQEKTVLVRGLRLSQTPFMVQIQQGNNAEEKLDLAFIREIKLLHKKA